MNNNHDYLVKAIAFDNHVRIYAVTCPNALNTIGDRLDYYPSALAAVGRVMSVGLMMGAMLKLEETVTIKVEGNGPIGLILVDADAKGNVRAYCSNPHCHYEYADKQKLNVRATVGDSGFINVIKDLKLKEPFIGSTPIISGELAEDFAYYFSVSEQIPSVVSLGVLVDEDSRAKTAGGFIIQLLPNTPDEVIDLLENKMKDFPTMSTLLSSGKTPEDIIRLIAGDDETILETIPVNFKCNCSRERFENGLISLGKDEIKEIIETDGCANTICHFCGNEYNFSKEDLTRILHHIEEKEKTKQQ